MIARPERPSRRLRRKVLEALRAQGCVCDVIVKVTDMAGKVTVAGVYHDDWCPLLRVRSEGAGGRPVDVIVYPERDGGDAA